MSITATELEILKIIKEKNGLLSMKELSSKARFEIGYTYLLCKSLSKHGCVGFFTHSSCRITAKGKSLVIEQERIKAERLT
jgi:DNA-binding IclR family transcriptional regulator